MYELALHFNPHCAEACNNLGVIYKDRDNLDKAVECYQVCHEKFASCRFQFPLEIRVAFLYRHCKNF
jgi:lipoprotein NlpI